MSGPRLAPAGLGGLDLADPRVHSDCDLAGVWRRLRDEEPACWHEAPGRPGFWVISRHADVCAVYRDAGRFTSERGNVLETLLAGGDPAAGKMAAVTDGRRHAELRAIMTRGLAPRMLELVGHNVRTATERLVAAAVARGSCDFAADVAARIPLAAICDLLGVPESDRGLILAMTSSALASDSGTPTDVDTWSAKNEILLYFAALAAQRRARPADDVLSLLVSSQIGGQPLAQDEIIYNCYSLIMGGDETTRYSIIGGVRALIEHPDQWQALKDGTVSIESAVEEVLRWTTPTLHAGRTATADVLLGGRLIEAGDLVTVWNASANNDERQFAAPAEFRLARRPNKHVTFAFGPHFCVGAYLARLEIGALLAALTRQVREVALAGEPRRIYSNFLSGMCSLPVHLEAERRAAA